MKIPGITEDRVAADAAQNSAGLPATARWGAAVGHRTTGRAAVGRQTTDLAAVDRRTTEMAAAVAWLACKEGGGVYRNMNTDCRCPGASFHSCGTSSCSTIIISHKSHHTSPHHTGASQTLGGVTYIALV